MKQIYFTVTNDLSYDQRMHRICNTLAGAGYAVTLVGRALQGSRALEHTSYQQKRLSCFFNKGFLFYGEYNLRLFFYLLTKNIGGICAIDLDTILPCLLISKIKRAPRIYDAHEYFTALKEVHTRPVVKNIWTWIENFSVPYFKQGYTVSEGLAAAFYQKFGLRYMVIRNLPLLKTYRKLQKEKPFLLYTGAVNEGRCFEILIPAMKRVPYPLVVCGDGNFMEKLKALITENGVEDKVELKGMLLPTELGAYTAKATLGIGLAESEGINQYHALPNKFLDYIHAGLPQLAMNFPEYKRINDQYKVALLLDQLSVDGVAATINQTMENKTLLQAMTEEALRAREVFCWQNEAPLLLDIYASIFGQPR